MYCVECGGDIKDKAVVCVKCGCEVKSVGKKKESPSFIIALAWAIPVAIVFWCIGRVLGGL